MILFFIGDLFFFYRGTGYEKMISCRVGKLHTAGTEQ